MKINRPIFAILILGLLGLFSISGWFISSQFQKSKTMNFNGERALIDVGTIVGLGPRIPDSMAHTKAIGYIQDELKKAGWTGTVLKQDSNSHIAYNILATRSSLPPAILLGAHYDSRIFADNDPVEANRLSAVPGANDGASGVAVLLELARTLPGDSATTAMLFIDIEDNGHIPGWEWILGSKAFASQMTIQPEVIVILDMIGDSDLNIFMEKNSDSEFTQQIWKSAKNLGYGSTFIPEYKYRVLDDHVPFIEKGFRAVDIIDLDYPYWHTTYDTTDKISAASLQIIGETLLAWIRDYGSCLQASNCGTP